MFGPLAALASGGQVGDLDGGGSATDRRACQVLRCGLVMLVQAGGAGIGLHPEGGERKKAEKRGITMQKGLVCKMNGITQIQLVLHNTCHNFHH